LGTRICASGGDQPAERELVVFGSNHSRLVRTGVVLGAVLAGLLGVLAAPGTASARTRASAPSPRVAVPATPKHLPAAIESPWTPYVAQDSCNPVFQRGTRKLVALLKRTYPDVYAGGAYACGTDGSVSEHYDGRASDWMASVKNKKQHAEALALLNWLLKPDAQGNDYAMARRLGVMYLIYDNRIWGSWDRAWAPYNNCAKHKQAAYDNSCHRTHVHISLTWNGAMGRTSFWTKKVTPTDYGPCRAKGRAWARKYVRYNPNPCPRTSGPSVPKGASPAAKAVASYSGLYLHRGSTGPAVSALQAVLHVSTSGNYLGQTRAAVRKFQRAHGLPSTGAMNRRTWQRLLATVLT
jgi:hypothetical protein